jgi:hypothetical protein
LPAEEGHPTTSLARAVGGGSPVEQQGAVRRSRGESAASMGGEMQGRRQALLLHRQGHDVSLDILETVGTVPCTSRTRVAPCFLCRQLDDAPHLGAVAHSSTGQASRDPQLLRADLAPSSSMGTWRLHLGQLCRWRMGRWRSREGALAACRSGGGRSFDGGPPHIWILPLPSSELAPAAASTSPLHRRRSLPLPLLLWRRSCTTTRHSPSRSPAPVQWRGIDEGAARGRSRRLFFSPFQQPARTNRRCVGPRHTVLSRESVCTGEMREKRGRLDFPVILEGTTAGGQAFIRLFQETDKCPSANGLTNIDR